MISGDFTVAFASFKDIGVVSPDDGSVSYPRFSAPKQDRWQWGPVLPDKQRIVVTSYEDAAIDRVVVGEVETHIWLYDFARRDIREILTRNRPAPFTTCAAICSDGERLVGSAIVDGRHLSFTRAYVGKATGICVLNLTSLEHKVLSPA